MGSLRKDFKNPIVIAALIWFVLAATPAIVAIIYHGTFDVKHSHPNTFFWLRMWALIVTVPALVVMYRIVRRRQSNQ